MKPNRATQAAAVRPTTLDTPTDREAQPRWALFYMCIAAMVLLAAGFYVLASEQTRSTLLPLGSNDSDSDTTLHSAGRSGRHNRRASSHSSENTDDSTDHFLLRTGRD
ncbi:hypothetical protein MTO96_019257 [Rhipicephalus appendiculatus]